MQYGPKLLRHYDTYAISGEEGPPLQLSVFPTKVSAVGEAPLILNLSERAQAELIRSIAAKTDADPGKLMSLLSEPFEPSPAPCAWAKKTSMTKRLVFTVSGELDSPADRIDKLDIALEFLAENKNGIAIDPRATFTSWDRFTSTYADFNIGTAKFTQSSKFTVGTGSTTTAGTTGGLEKIFNLGYERNNSLDESAVYALRRLVVGGELSQTKARLIQEGAPNITLFGSSVAVITFSLRSRAAPVHVYSFVLTDEGKFLAPSEVKTLRCADQYPIIDEDIVAEFKGMALVRKVRSGGSTVSEGDDDVLMVRRPLSGGRVVLANTADLSVPRFYLLECPPDFQEIDRCKALRIETDGPRSVLTEEIVLSGYQAAADLRNWLVDRTKKSSVSFLSNRKIGLSRLGEKVIPITAKAASELRIVQISATAL